jgi:hypothetical protein
MIREIILTLAANDLYSFRCMNCRHQPRYRQEYRKFLKMPVDQLKSLLDKLQLDEDDDINIDSAVDDTPDVSLKQSAIDRLERVCKEFLGL